MTVFDWLSLQKSVGMGHFNRIWLNGTKLTATILDCTMLIDDVRESVLDTSLHENESTARGRCFALHLNVQPCEKNRKRNLSVCIIKK